MSAENNDLNKAAAEAWIKFFNKVEQVMNGDIKYCDADEEVKAWLDTYHG